MVTVITMSNSISSIPYNRDALSCGSCGVMGLLNARHI